MKHKNIIVAILLLLLIPACSSNNNQPLPKLRTYLFQVWADSPLLMAIKKEITPVINSIIKDELALAKNYDFDFFLPKNRNALTLYYVNNADENGQHLLESILDDMQKANVSLITDNVAINPTVNFFGDQEDELVIMVDDLSDELSKLNREIKKLMHNANEEYKDAKYEDLYNITKSERYPFLPHIGLGRIRVQSIAQRTDRIERGIVLAAIQKRIIKAVTNIVEEKLAKNNRKIFFNKLCMFDLEKRACIKAAVLKD